MMTQLWKLFTFKMFKVHSFHNVAATDKEIYDMYMTHLWRLFTFKMYKVCSFHIVDASNKIVYYISWYMYFLLLKTLVSYGV